MATVTTIDTDLTVRHQSSEAGPTYVSAAAQPGDTVTLTYGTTPGFDLAEFPHCFVGVLMYDGADGTGSLVLSGATTFTLTVQTVNTKYDESLATSTITGNAPATRSWAGNTFQVKCVDAGITGAANSWRLVITGNRT